VIVLDTNVLSELMRPDRSEMVVRWFGAQPIDELRITAVTIAETRYGIERLPVGRRRTALNDRAEEVLRQFGEQALPFDLGSARRYATIVADRERVGCPISIFDAQIASICRHHDATLATRNVADFAGTGLVLVDPWSASQA
jgi:toxin FitB